jgi:WD40 repeat protein
MVRIRFASVCLLFTTLLVAPSFSQENCPALTVPQMVPGINMFSDEQEVYLGDVQAAWLEQTITIIKDQELTSYLQKIVDRLAQNLPPNHMQLKVKLIDVPTADAFSIAGGRIYISRKIVAVVRNEDEMAGLLAHEMGHVAAHHEAIQASEQFRQVLGITQVGGREDITARWNQLLSSWRREKISGAGKSKLTEDREQEQADAVALYLMSRSGYSPAALVGLFDRMAQTKGNTGGFWSDLFHTTTPDAKRLRQMIASKSAMPASCIAQHTEVAAAFEQWQKSVIDYSTTTASAQEQLPGLIHKLVLTERLRPQIQHIRISPDGKYVLAQDDSNIFVLTRDPFKSVFRFDAPDAAPAQFTPDSRNIVVLFATVGASPRVERWDIAGQKRLEAHEIYVRDACVESVLSPDGNTLACATPADESSFVLDLQLYDVRSGASFWEKKHFAWLPVRREFALAIIESQPSWAGLIRVSFSPDAKYVLANGRDNILAMDLGTRSAVNVPGSIRNLLTYDFTFLADGGLLGVAGKNGEKSQVVEFPSGRAITNNLVVGASSVSPVAHGDHVLLRPIKDNPLGVLDLKQNRIVLASKIDAMDLWDNTYIAERDDGDLQIFELGSEIKALARAPLPDASMDAVRAAAVSPDLRWMAVSQASRGAVWDLDNGHRLYHLRGFRGAYFSTNGGVCADFPKHLKDERMIACLALNSSNVQTKRTVDEKQLGHQVGRYWLALKSPGEKDSSNGSLELHEITDDTVVWSKPLPHGGPQSYTDSPADSFVLRWSAERAEHELGKNDPQVNAALSQFKKKDGIEFFQIFDLPTGKLRAQVPIDTGKNSFVVRDAISAADRLVLADNHDRVLVYSFDGQLKGTITGHYPEVSAKSGLLTVRTERGELELYDLASMQKRATYDFSSRVAFNGFSGDGKRLLVLTADQVVYVLDPAATSVSTSVAEK